MTLWEIANEMNSILWKSSQSHDRIIDYPWENVIYYSNLFRWGHVEFYKYNTAEIVHCVIMPHSNDAAGIFGFDVIEINGNRTGLFMDITPTVGKPEKFIEGDLGDERDVPGWGAFSENFVAVKPNDGAPEKGLEVMQNYVNSSLQKSFGEKQEILSAQQSYVEMQRSNDKTFKMLKSHVGEEKAKKFMEEIMFPDVI